MTTGNYIKSIPAYLHYKRWVAGMVFITVVLFIVFTPFASTAQPKEAQECSILNIDSCYDRTSVCIKVQGLGEKEMVVVLYANDVYLPVSAFFHFLKVKHNSSVNLDTITGLIFPDNTFLIDRVKNYIRYKSADILLKPNDLIRTGDDLYLKLEYFTKIFGFECRFEYDNLSVKINTPMDLPAIREKRLQMMRSNINHLKGEQLADTTIAYKNPLFHFGMADWSVITTNQLNEFNNVRFNLGLGANIAGTEANIGINYFNNTPFNWKQQYYLWRYANNDKKALRQVTAGRILLNAASSIYSPVIGLQFTNAPTKLRQSFGTYRLTDITQPDWVIEAYVNNVLVNYTKADATGFFAFDIPLVYGNTVIKLQFYGPWGEEYTRIKNINIPFTFLPKNEFEYTISNAIVEDDKGSYISRSAFNFGLSQNITVGAGVEYLSSITKGGLMPYINTSVKLGHNLLLSGEFLYGVRGKGIMSYRMGSKTLEVYYTKYTTGQKAILFNYLEERKAVLTMPFRRKHISGLSRVMVNQAVLPNKRSYTNASWLLSAGINNVSIALNNFMLSSPGSTEQSHYNQYAYCDLSLSVKIAKRILFIPQVQYAYSNNEFISMKYKLEYNMLRKYYFDIAYERNFRSDLYSTSIGVRCDMSFAKAGISARQFNDRYTLTTFARGSFIYDNKTNYLSSSNRPTIRTGGVIFLSYLDINGNRIKDINEPRVQGLKVDVKGGRIVYDDNDTLVRILNLEPYVNYYFDLSRNNFQNITWQTTLQSINVRVVPNQLQLIEVPIAVKTEISGYIHRNTTNNSGIKVCFYDEAGHISGFVYTDDDGYFNNSELRPGRHVARIDPAYLKKSQQVSVPDHIAFSIKASVDGAEINNIDFNLSYSNIGQ